MQTSRPKLDDASPDNDQPSLLNQFYNPGAQS